MGLVHSLSIVVRCYCRYDDESFPLSEQSNSFLLTFLLLFLYRVNDDVVQKIFIPQLDMVCV